MEWGGHWDEEVKMSFINDKIDELKRKHAASVKEHREAKLQKEAAERIIRAKARTAGLKEEEKRAIANAKRKADIAASRELAAYKKRLEHRDALKKALYSAPGRLSSGLFKAAVGKKPTRPRRRKRAAPRRRRPRKKQSLTISF